MLLVAVAYFLGAKLGFALTLPPQAVSTLWPPNAILLAALLLTPPRSWWIVLLAALPAHLAVELGSGVPVPMVVCWFVSNCSEALIGAGCIRLVTRDALRLDRFRHVGLFVGFGAFLSVFLSSFVDIAFVTLNHWGSGGFWEAWRTRFFSNVLTALTIVPVILAGARGDLATLRTASAWRYVEGGLLAAALVSVCLIVFVAGPHTTPALLYAPMPLLLWAAVRFGPPGMSMSILLVALVAIWGAIHGSGGPFVYSSPAENALAIQLFLIVIAVPLMTLAAVIEERKHAEGIARRSGEQLELALGAAQLGTWEWAIPGNQLSWSAKSRDILGIRTDEPDPPLERFLDLVSADDRPAVMRAVRHAIDRGAVYEAEFRVDEPQGGVRWVMSKGQAHCDSGGYPVRMVGVVGDITERKRAEAEAATRWSELVRVNRAAMLGELAGALAHELNQPLTAILANARTGEHLLAGKKPNLAELAAILADIASDDLRAGEVIHRLQALMRKSPMKPGMLDVNDIVIEVLSMVQYDLTQRDVSVDLNLARSLPQVVADRVQLRQVVFHLVMNALEAIGDRTGGDRLTITTTQTADRCVQLSVMDPGTGIPADQLDQVFRPFFTSKRERPGMGLAICRSIVTAHSGLLWAVNNPDRGATFHVVLPGASPATAAMSPGA